MTVLYLVCLQDVNILDSTAATATHPVPLIVKTARVTYKVECVSRANLDGLIWIVIKVIVFFHEISYQNINVLNGFFLSL